MATPSVNVSLDDIDLSSLRVRNWIIACEIGSDPCQCLRRSNQKFRNEMWVESAAHFGLDIDTDTDPTLHE